MSATLMSAWQGGRVRAVRDICCIQNSPLRILLCGVGTPDEGVQAYDERPTLSETVASGAAGWSLAYA